MRTIVCHLADTETVLAMRLRQVIAEDNPMMPAMNQDAWAERLDKRDTDERRRDGPGCSTDPKHSIFEAWRCYSVA